MLVLETAVRFPEVLADRSDDLNSVELRHLEVKKQKLNRSEYLRLVGVWRALSVEKGVLKQRNHLVNSLLPVHAEHTVINTIDSS